MSLLLWKLRAGACVPAFQPRDMPSVRSHGASSLPLPSPVAATATRRGAPGGVSLSWASFWGVKRRARRWLLFALAYAPRIALADWAHVGPLPRRTFERAGSVVVPSAILA